MTELEKLQKWLLDTGRYTGRVDNAYGPKTRAAILKALEDGPDTALTEQDFLNSAARLGVKPWTIMAFAEVEAAGAGFFAGMPKILPERHRFAKLTEGRFNRSHPHLSYWKWGSKPYPGKQADRYELLLDMIGLDVTAGFAACSYGKFQILGENHLACHYATPWHFAFAMAVDEPTQLRAFENFIRENGLLPFLRQSMWTTLAKRYNGPAYAKNRYDVKLAQAAAKHQRRMEG